MQRALLPTWGLLILLACSIQAQETFLGKSADGWVKQLKESALVNERRNAAFALGKMGQRVVHVLPELKLALKREKDTKVRETIVFALGDICREISSLSQDRELEQLFIDALKDGDPLIRRSAAYALGCQGSTSEAVRTALDAALGDANSRVRQNVAWAFGKLGRALGKQGELVLPSLQKALKDEDSFVKRDAASSLLQIENADKVHDLVNQVHPLCRDTNSEVRRAALNVLVRIVNEKDRDAIPNLHWALQDRDLENKRNAALALSNIGGEETAIALPVLLEAARNGELDLRRQSVLAIRNIGASASTALPELVRFLRDDKDEQIRQYAVLALGGIGKASEPAIPLLVQKIGDKTETPEIRHECVMTLSRIGLVPTAKTVVPDLLKVLGDPSQNNRVRQRIPWALRRHGNALPDLPGTLDTFTKVLKEPDAGTFEHRLLRYECAYTLGIYWQQKAPEATLDVLSQFLHDTTVKLFDKTASGVSGSSAETKAGTAVVQERVKGDGRTMATDALSFIGASRYAKRADIMKQLKVIAADNTAYQPLQKKAEELIKAAQ